MQVYFLLILLNITVGFIVASENYPVWKIGELRQLLEQKNWLFMVGLLCILASFLGFLSPVSAVFILGDFFPASSLLALGVVLVIGRYYAAIVAWQEGESQRKWLKVWLINIWSYRIYVGFTAIIAGILHFLFSDILLL